MGSLGIPEVLIIVVMILVYTVIPPLVLSIALRIFLRIAADFGVPDALGKFGAAMAQSFREHKATAEE
ncbi:MAG TPA: hypothetical protein VN687_05680 [Blastocatellia bacterium]|nr:hypothetical protein [Blastocatellia bacterium]